MSAGSLPHRPTLFLIGAPKCGTTSLAAWMAEHPAVCMSDPKEPDFFDSDRRKGFEVDAAGYAKCFRRCTADHAVIGEASTGYLRSRVAVPAIEQWSPGARYIVGLRNPVDMARSWHGQTVFEAWETESDFETAWRLQDARRAGKHVPSSCRQVDDLMYGDVCRLGAQVDRLLSWVDRERVCFYRLEELHEPSTVYRRVLRFAGLDDDGRSEFATENAARDVPRWVRLLHRTVSDAKRRLGIADRGLGIVTALGRRTARARSSEMSAELRAELTEFFAADVALLAERTGLDLSSWSEQPPLTSD